jgi:hypothetical protein
VLRVFIEGRGAVDSRAVLLQQGKREDLEGEALVIDDVPMQNV